MNPQLPQDPMQDANPELEALNELTMQGNESLGGIETSSEASAVKLNEIEENQEAQIVQGEKNTDRMVEPLNQIADNTSKLKMQQIAFGPREDQDDATFNENEAGKVFWNMLRGPKGYTPIKGKDYFTEEETADFLKDSTPVKGKDYFTDKEVETFLKKTTPVKGRDYKDGEDGRNPVTISNKVPSNAVIGDIWYQP